MSTDKEKTEKNKDKVVSKEEKLAKTEKETKYIYIGNTKSINGIMFRKYTVIAKKFRDKAVEEDVKNADLFKTMKEFAEHKKTMSKRKGGRINA